MRTGSFWSGAEGAPLIVLTDFDYTITQVDVGDLICDTLAPPSLETLRQIRSGEVGPRAYWLDSLTRVDPAAALALAGEVAIDPAFHPFSAFCREQAMPLAVVSDGFWFYIRQILEREGLGSLPVFCNELPAAGRLEFPHANPACDRCGCCKPSVVRQAKALGARVVYVGDGTSDMYASAFADWVFAKGSLARFLDRAGTPFFPFDSFADVQGRLAADLEGFRRGTAPGRVQMQPSPYCRFTD